MMLTKYAAIVFLLTCSWLLTTCNLTFQQESFWKRESSQRRRFMVHSILVHSIDRRIQLFDIFLSKQTTQHLPTLPLGRLERQGMGKTFFEKVTEGEKRLELYVRVSTIFQCLNDFSMMICQDQKRHQLYILHHRMCVCVCVNYVSTQISIPNVDKVPFHISWVCPKSNDVCVVSPKLE